MEPSRERIDAAFTQSRPSSHFCPGLAYSKPGSRIEKEVFLRHLSFSFSFSFSCLCLFCSRQLRFSRIGDEKMKTHNWDITVQTSLCITYLGNRLTQSLIGGSPPPLQSRSCSVILAMPSDASDVWICNATRQARYVSTICML